MALPIATPAPVPMLPTPAAATPLATPVPAATPAPAAPDGFDPDDYLKGMAAAPAASFDPDSYLKDSLQKYVDDDNFDPLVMAYEQPDKLDLAKEIEWRKSQRPMTGARAGKAVKNVAKAVPGIIHDFGTGLGAIAGDAIIQATDDTPANVERAKTQQLARAQLIEQHTGSFMGKLFGPDSWLGKNVFTPERDVKATASYKRAELARSAPPGPAKDAALAQIDAEEKEGLAAIAAKPAESNRQASDRMFESKLAQVKRERELIKGNPQPDGAVAGTLQGIGDITRTLVTGEPVNDDLSAVTNTFKSGDQLNAMGAPVDQEAIRTGAVTADPINLLPLHVPGMNKLAGKIGGALLKTPATIAEKVAENTPEIVSNTLKKKVLGTAAVAGGGAITAEAIHDPAGAAKMLAAAGIATAGLAGAKYFGRVMDVAGSKLIDPKYISAAERAGAESAMNIEKSGGSKFFDPAMNKADLERALVKPIQGAVTAPIAMAPLNAALSDNPEEFGSLTGSAMGFGAFAGATAYNPAKGFHPETVAAVDSILRDNGAKKEYGTPLDAQHAAFMADAPEGVKDAVNSYRGFFDGFKLPNGREPQIYVLPAEQFGAEVAKRRPDVTPDVAAKQRGFAGKDGTILINGDYGGETPGILGHEAGGHVAQSIMEVLAPEVAKSMNDAALKGLTDASGNPTPKLKKFVDAYNKEFDPTGKTKEIQTTDHAISEWLAEQGRAVLEGQGPAKFAAGQSVRQTIGDNLADHFHKVFGTKQMFDRGQVPALARQYRDLLFSLGRFRTQEGPQTAPPEGQAAPGDPAAAPAPEAAAATPASPAGGEPAPAGSAGDRRTVSDAMMALFGVKRAEADAMAAAAKGSTVEQMVASAAQAKSKAVAGSRTTAPAAQPVPVQPAGAAVEPTGQLGAIKAAEPVPAAPAGQLSGVGESAPAVAAKPKMRVSRTPDGGFEYRDENGNLIPTDANGQPVRPGTAPDTSSGGRQGVATPPEAPARPVVAPEDITARVQAAEDAARTLEATKKRKTPESREKATAQAVKEARIQALLDAAHESAPDEAHLQKREEFGTTKYTGRIDESIPAHRMLLDELGVSKGGRDNIDTLNANMGKAVFIDYKSAAKEGSNEATQAAGEVDTTSKQRSKEYKAEPVDARIKDAQAGDVNTGVEQTKAFVPLGFRVNGSKGSVTVTGFSPNRLLANAGKIIGFMRSKGRETGYSGPDDPAIHDDMQGYAQNHANGYKGDGSGPIAGENPNSHYEPHIIDSTRFDLLNAAMGNEGAKTPKTSREGAQERAGDLQDFAAANDTLLTPEGETNPLRQWLNDNDFAFKNEAGEDRTGTKEVLEPTIESLRVDPELMRSVSTEAPEHEASLRPTGVADPSAMAAQGIPKARNVAAGFMPGQGSEKGQLSNFDGDKEEPSIKSKVGDFMPGNEPEEKQLQGFDRKPKADELGFYSRLRQHVDEADFGRSKAKAAQHWLGVIEKWAKGASTPTLGVQSRGIARDELEWSGIREWLKSQGSTPIKKADVLNFIDHNGVQVDEVQKGGGASNGEAYYMDDEPQDHSYAFDEHAGAWLIDAYPNSDYFGEGETDGMDTKSLAAIFLKGDKGQISYLDGKYHASLDVGRDDLGDFSSREEAQAAINAANEEAHGAKEYEIWDVRDGHNYQVDSATTFEEATQKARELARDSLQQINRSHSDDGEEGGGGTQFSGYKLDGGKNYKEVLLKLPEGKTTSDRDNFTESHWSEPNVVAHFRQQDFEGMVRPAEESIKDYMARGGNRETEKVRHIDEFQSDWHQKGRERGYRGDQATVKELASIESKRVELKKQFDDLTSRHDKARDLVGELSHQAFQKMGLDNYREILSSPKKAELQAELDRLRDQNPDFIKAQEDQERLSEEQGKVANEMSLLDGRKRELNQAVPDAPFKKSWAQLAFKRALKLAVEDGNDRMSWSTGDQNIDHYKNALTAEVQKITWTHPPDSESKVVTMQTQHGGFMRFDVSPDGTISNSGGGHVAAQFEGKDLADVIGRDNAKKILAPGEGDMDGEGMEVGGDGMRTFYDEMIPQFANKYVSKWGSKVEDVTLPTGDVVHSVKITPEMKAAVEQGQPMFMPGNRGAEQAAGSGKQLEDFGPVNSLGFYSGLRQTVDKKVPNRASAEQVKRVLDPANGGAKKEELEALGLPQFLEGKTHVTKKELLEFIDTHGVELKESPKLSEPTQEQRDEFDDLAGKKAEEIHSRLVDEAIERMVERHGMDEDQIDRDDVSNEIEWDDNVLVPAHNEAAKELGYDIDEGDQTRFGQYQLKHSIGENYKELNYVLPDRTESKAGWQILDSKGTKIGVPVEDKALAERSAARFNGTVAPVEFAARSEENYTVPGAHQYGDNTSDRNRLYHTRQADHVDTEGKRVRMVEEWQSDWHQTGREKGYLSDFKNPDTTGWVVSKYESRSGETMAEIKDANGEVVQRGIKAEDKSDSDLIKAAIAGRIEGEQAAGGAVPDAPFKKSWHELAFKKSLGDAVRDGMDKLAWTTGDQQAERYDLSKQVDDLTYRKVEAGYRLIAGKDGTVVVNETVPEEKLADMVGKEVAKKIIEGEGRDEMGDTGGKVLSGIDLKVGGAGMKGFYDKIIVNFANKYLKPWGIKVEKTTLPINGGVSGEAVMDKLGIPKAKQGDYWRGLEMKERNQLLEDFRKDGDTVHSVTITPELRKAIGKGQPMFMPGKGPDKPAGDLSDFGGDEEGPKYVPRTEAGRKIAADGYDLTAENLYESSHNNRVIKVEKDGEPVGHIAFTIDPRNRYAHLDEVSVEPDFQKKGVGSALYREMAAELQSRRVTHIGGDVVSEVPMNIRKSVFGKFDMVSDDINELTESEARERLPATPPDMDDFGGDKVFVRNKIHPTKKFMPGQGPDSTGDLSDFGKDEPSIESKVGKQDDFDWAQPKRAKAAGDVVVQVKTDAFDKAFQKDAGFYIDKDGNGEIKGRRERFQEFLDKGQYDPKSGEYNKVPIEMPEAVVTKDGAAAFTNGRHRFSVMRDNGVESLPVSMDETSALRAQTLGLTVDSKQGDGKQLGRFMPSDATGRGEFDVKEKPPVDERRARLMADMQGQSKWLTAQAKEKGFDSVDDLSEQDPEAFGQLAKQWREAHPRFDAEGKQLFMPGSGEPINSAETAGADPKDKKAAMKAWLEKKTDSPWFKQWFGGSKVVGEDGKPLVTYSGHAQAQLYGDAYDPKKSTAGAFYATEDPDIASNYSLGKLGVKEEFENGSQYRLQQKNGKFGKKISQVELTPEQQEKAKAFLADEDNGISIDLEKYWKEHAPFDADARRAQYQGLRSLTNIYRTMESLGYTIAYPREAKDLPSGEREPLFMTQQQNHFEDLLDHLGIKWQSHDFAQPAVQPIYLKIENPLDASQPFPDDLMAALEKAAKRDRSPQRDVQYAQWTSDYPLKQWVQDIKDGDEYWTTHIPSKALPIIKSFGYDGIKELGSKGAKTREERQINWLAFDPGQIKSAIGNRGTFDETEPSMTAMPGDSDGPQRTWFMRGGKRIYHHRDGDGLFAEKPALAKIGRSATSSQTDDEDAKAQLQKFK